MSDDLRNSPSWKPEYFCSDGVSIRGSKFPMVKLGTVVRERGETVDPQTDSVGALTYIGLENVEPITGRLQNVKTCEELSVLSRSKRFAPDDVLYGRLRPSLNKVCLPHNIEQGGICSNEFLVLRADISKILPVVLRAIISTEYVTSYVASRLSGSALPRLSAKDLLSLEIPLPPMRVQLGYLKILEDEMMRYEKIAKLVAEFPNSLMNGLVCALETGSSDISQRPN